MTKDDLREIIKNISYEVLNEMSPVRSNTFDFIHKAEQVHGKRYDYSQVHYLNNRSRVTIICPIHGKFVQLPKNHLQGKGCPRCNDSHLEKNVARILNTMNIDFEQNYKSDWMLRGMHLDFYLPHYNIAIECQGIQHFEPIPRFGGEKRYARQIQLDTIKKELCETHNIPLFYIKYNDKLNEIEQKINNIIKS